MRFMIIRKADPNTEAGLLPGREMLAAMGRYHEELVKAGAMLGGEGLRASAKGTRVNFSKGELTVTDGPFTETKEVIAGFLLIEAKSKEEAIAWAKRCPTLCGAAEVEMEVRQVVEASDFPAEMTPELSGLPWTTVAGQAEQRLRARGQEASAMASPNLARAESK
ncbi:MAG: YciI family protein [Alphaproteobacteria bacterium]